MRRLAAIIACLVVGCAEPGPPIVASDVEVTRPIPGMAMSAAYLVLTNTTGEPISITRVTSPQFGSVEMHETRIEEGVSRMRRLDRIDVPAHGQVRFERGGKHLMLMRPRHMDRVLTLQFFDGGTPILTIDFEMPSG